jgi:hypothetical protein
MPDNRVLQKGEILFYQWDNPVKLYMLQEGEIEILSAPEEFAGLDPDIIIDKSVRVCSLKGRAMLVGFSGPLTSQYSKSARAANESVIVEYPLPQGGFKGVAARDLNGSINMLRQIFNNYMMSQAQLKKAISLYARLSQIDDNLSILYHVLSSGGGPEAINKKAEDLYTLFSLSKVKIPEVVAADFIIEDKSSLLKKSYTEKLTRETANPEYIELIKKILKLDPQILAAVFKGDPEIPVSIFSSVAGVVNSVLDNVHEIMDKISQKLKTLYSSTDGWTKYFSGQNGVKEWQSGGRISPDFFTNMVKINSRIDAMYLEITGRRLDSVPGYTELNDAFGSRETVTEEKSEPQTVRKQKRKLVLHLS